MLESLFDKVAGLQVAAYVIFCQGFGAISCEKDQFFDYYCILFCEYFFPIDGDILR